MVFKFKRRFLRKESYINWFYNRNYGFWIEATNVIDPESKKYHTCGLKKVSLRKLYKTIWTEFQDSVVKLWHKLQSFPKQVKDLKNNATHFWSLEKLR